MQRNLRYLSGPGFVFLIILVFYSGGENNPPPNLPDNCIAYFNKWNAYLKKMEASKRFDVKTMAAFDWYVKNFFAKMSKKNSAPYKSAEDKNEICKKLISSNTFKVIDNMDNLGQLELEELLSVERIKSLHQMQKNSITIKPIRLGF